MSHQQDDDEMEKKEGQEREQEEGQTKKKKGLTGGITLASLRETEKYNDECRRLFIKLKRAEDAVNKPDEETEEVLKGLKAKNVDVEALEDPSDHPEIDGDDLAVVRKHKAKLDTLKALRQEVESLGCVEGKKEQVTLPSSEEKDQAPFTLPPLPEIPPELAACNVPPKEATEKKQFGFAQDRAIPQQRPPAGACGLPGDAQGEEKEDWVVCGDNETANRSNNLAPKEEKKPSTDTRFPLAVLGREAGSRFLEEDPSVAISRALREKKDRLRRSRDSAGVGLKWMLHPRLKAVRRWFTNDEKPRGWIILLASLVMFIFILLAIEKLPLSWLSFLKSRFVITGMSRVMERFATLRHLARQFDGTHLFLVKMRLMDFLKTLPMFVMFSQPLLYPKYVLALLVVAIVPFCFYGNMLLLLKSVGAPTHIRRAISRLRMWMSRHEFTRGLLFLVPFPSVAAAYIPRLMVVISATTPLPVFRLLLSKMRPVWDEWLFDAVPPPMSSFLGALSALSTLLLFAMEDVFSSTKPHPEDSREGLETEERDDEGDVGKTVNRNGLDNANLYMACSLMMFVALFVVARHLYPELRSQNHLHRLGEVAKFVNV